MSLLVKRGDSPQDRFASEVLELFRSDARVEDAWYDREHFAISVRPANGGPVLARLSDVYEQWGLADVASRVEPLRQFVADALAPPELPAGWEQARTLVRPVLRGVTAALPSGPEPSSGALWRQSLPYLAELVELDLPGSPRVPVALAAQWGIPGEDVFATAMENLRTRQARPRPSGPAKPRVLRLVDDGGMYWVSQLLIDGWLAEFSSYLGTRPVAFAPDRATLLVAPDDPQLLTSVFEMVEEEYGQSARPVSPMAYTAGDDGRVVPYPVPAGHPLTAAVGRAERVLANAEYGRQKRWLDDSSSPHRAAGLMLSGRANGSVFSVASLAGGGTLLPRSDYVTVTQDEDVSFVPWTAAEQILGLKPEPDLEPPRFLVESWPTDDACQALTAARVNPATAPTT